VAKGMLDAFIVNAPLAHDPRITYLREERIPFVVHGREAAQVDYPFFDIDNALVSELATELVCDLGHSRIALLNGPDVAAFARDRSSGFLRTLDRRSIEPSPALLFNGPLTESFGYATTLKLLGGTLGVPPTAIVCSSTSVAQGAYRAVRDRGLQVGQDVSIVSHDDDIPELPAVAFAPPLTVTRSPLTDACRPLAELLVASIRNGGSPPAGRVATPELIVRSSTGPALR
jgi:LacI family transcriptional regulator